jgi:hypothetical protein
MMLIFYTAPSSMSSLINLAIPPHLRGLPWEDAQGRAIGDLEKTTSRTLFPTPRAFSVLVQREERAICAPSQWSSPRNSFPHIPLDLLFYFFSPISISIAFFRFFFFFSFRLPLPLLLALQLVPVRPRPAQRLHTADHPTPLGCRRGLLCVLREG